MFPSLNNLFSPVCRFYLHMKLRRILSAFLCIGFFFSCNSTSDTSKEAPQEMDDASTSPAQELSFEQEILAKAMEAHGGESALNAHFEFDFRDKHYVYNMQEGIYQYERHFEDSLGQEVRDILENDKFTRLIQGDTVQVTQERADAYANSVNSVIYFSFLPFRLKDPAVQMQSLGACEIKGMPYEKIFVTFRQEDGGKDYSDKYVYWFHQEKGTLDYLAYSYEVDEGGTRFREAINPREVGGLRFQDYINYAGEKDTDVRQMDSLFQAGSLEEVSRIENVNIQKIAAEQ